MRKINYKLIVSDFDGTLIDDNQNVPEQVKKAISEYINAGGIFAVCTGRMLRSILPQVRKLGLSGLVIANQGSVIADIESGNLLKCNSIPYVDVAEICSNIKELNQPVNIYCGDNLYTDIPKNNEYLQLYERIVCVSAEYVNGQMSDFVLNKRLNCQKIAILVKRSERDALYLELNKRLGERFDVTCSAKELVEISPKGDTKGEAVKYLCNRFDISLEECIAVGDNLNDISMINTAGVGVAVENADDALKALADFISISNNDGAIAQIIEKYGFA